MASTLAKQLLRQQAQGHAAQQSIQDPWYETYIDAKGVERRRKRENIKGLTKADRKALRKLRKRAHRLDAGMRLCGFRFGYTLFIGFIPGVGDIADFVLSYTLVTRPAGKLGIPGNIKSRMVANNMVGTGFNLVPFVGDIAMAAWKGNSRNLILLEAFLVQRATANLEAVIRGEMAIDSKGDVYALPPDQRGRHNHVIEDPIATAPPKKKSWNPFRSEPKHETTQAMAPGIQGGAPSSVPQNAAPVGTVNTGAPTAAPAAPPAKAYTPQPPPKRKM